MAYYRPDGLEDEEEYDYDDFMLNDDYDGDDDDLMVPVVKTSTYNKHLGWRDVSNAGATNISESKWGPPPDKTKTKRSTESIVWENYRTPSQEHHNSKKVSPDSVLKQKPVLAVDDLRMAAMQNKADVVRQCINSGISVDSVYSSGWTALMYATNSANVECIHVLLEAGADPNFHKDLYTVLMSACSKTGGNESDILKCIELLIQKGADVNAFDRYHMSPLIYAAKSGYVSCVRKLAENKADLNKQDSRGYTGLIWAVFGGYIKVVHALLELGADVSKQTSDGSRAVDFAMMNNHTQIHELLKRHGDVSNRKLVLTEADLNEAEANQRKNNERKTAVTYGDLELFLSGLELGHMIPLFEDHKVTFESFLKMTDRDLQEIGVNQFGVRKKILDAIRQTHKKEWENSSLPSVQYNKKISCAEALAMVQNIKKHISYIATTIGFVTDQIKSDKQILVTAQEGVGAQQLCINSDEAMNNTRLLYKELTSLREHLARVKDEPGYRPPDLVLPSGRHDNKVNKNRHDVQKWGLLCRLTLGLGLSGALLWWKSELVTNSLKGVTERLQELFQKEV